ncbi:hypothetical protein QCA50_014336 [Cerrena zonata]|uniref:Uncharacterized protein n=1 Tax=Cerrena zonata TaxID=2478898 RepID=A0AAW0FPA7_9APHY
MTSSQSDSNVPKPTKISVTYSHADPRLMPCLNPVSLEVGPARNYEDYRATSPKPSLQQRPISPPTKLRRRNPSQTNSMDLRATTSPEPRLPAEDNVGRSSTPSSPIMSSPPTTPSKLIKRNPHKGLPPLPPSSPSPSRTRSLPSETQKRSPARTSRDTNRSDGPRSHSRNMTLDSFAAPNWGCQQPFGLASRFVEDFDKSVDAESQTPNKLRRKRPA